MIALRRPLSSWSGRLALASLAVATLAFPALAQAQAHRARVAQTLARQIAANGPGTVEALVQAPQSEIDRLSKTYGLRIVRRLALGALVCSIAAAMRSRMAMGGRPSNSCNVGWVAANSPFRLAM